MTTRTGTPAAITFTNQTGVYTAAPISSNAVTLSGFTGTVTAQCNTGCTAIAHNGTWEGTTVTDFAPNDTIAIKQTSSSSANTATTASVTVGSTTSATWSVTTGTDSCAGITTVGAVCPDGTVYAGITPDGNKKMMVTRCDAGMTWGGSSCTGTIVELQWNNGSTPSIATGYNSEASGKTNTDGLAVLFNAESPYAAAKYCYDLVTNGHSDWYLPAYQEWDVMDDNWSALNVTSVYWFWTSTEMRTEWGGSPETDAVYAAPSSGWGGGFANKTNHQAIRCVRTD